VTGLATSSDLLASIVLSSDDAIFALDRDRRIGFWNAGATQMFDHLAHDVVGQHVDMLLADEGRAHFDRLLDDAFAGTGAGHFETVLRTRTGSFIPVSVRISSLRDASANIVGASVIARDSAPRSKEDLVLRRRSEELERSNAELVEFAQVISHDLQEPLRTMKGFAELLEQDARGLLDEQTLALLDRIVQGAGRMQDLVTDLLAYARTGTQDAPSDVVDCEEVLDAALADLEASINEGDVILSHDGLPTVRGDRVSLTELFENLIGNAMKFRGSEVPRIHIGSDRQDRMWRLSVRDNGIGLDPRFAARIFQPFRRLHTRDEYSGSGMGLAICRKIVERHGGRIWVESSRGEGATFFFTLPAIA